MHCHRYAETISSCFLAHDLLLERLSATGNYLQKAPSVALIVLSAWMRMVIMMMVMMMRRRWIF